MPEKREAGVDSKESPPKPELTREELTILIQVLNQPRTMDLQQASKLIALSNKLSGMIDHMLERV